MFGQVVFETDDLPACDIDLSDCLSVLRTNELAKFNEGKISRVITHNFCGQVANLK